eukprot:scaffold15328_cov16-Prasinocladus_malaysianus.AAC.5
MPGGLAGRRLWGPVLAGRPILVRLILRVYAACSKAVRRHRCLQLQDEHMGAPPVLAVFLSGGAGLESHAGEGRQREASP